MPILQGVISSTIGADPPPPDFILGTTKPTASNTGLVSATTITNNNTEVAIAADVENTLFNGNVRITADNVTLYNCRIRGKTAIGTNPITRTNVAGVNGTVFERCQLDNRWWPSTNASDGAVAGIYGFDTTMIRCDISGAQDGIGFVGSNWDLQGCYIHDLWYFSPAAAHPTDGSHCDGIQGHGMTMTNLSIVGCTIEGLVDKDLPNCQVDISPSFSGSNLIAGNVWHTNVTPTFYITRAASQGLDGTNWGTSAILFGRSGTATLSNLTIDQNWLDGGSFAAINLNNGYTNSTATNIDITNNRLGTHTRDQTGGRPYLLICSSSLTTQLTLTGNVYEDTGLPILAPNLRRNG